MKIASKHPSAGRTAEKSRLALVPGVQAVLTEEVI